MRRFPGFGFGDRSSRMVFVAANDLTPTNASIVAALLRHGVYAQWLPPSSLLETPRRNDVVLARFDALPPVDCELPGIWELPELERRGVIVLNGRSALLAAIDRLATIRVLDRAGLPHPTTAYIAPGAEESVAGLTGPTGRPIELPVVVRPRFGGSAQDAIRCDTPRQLDRLLRVERPPWLIRDGALVQPAPPPTARQLQAVVADGAVVWAGERRPPSAPGWRGAARLPGAAAAVAVAAAHAVSADLVGVDMVSSERSCAVLALDGAVELEAAPGDTVYDDLSERLLAAVEWRTPAASHVPVGAGVPAPSSWVAPA